MTRVTVKRYGMYIASVLNSTGAIATWIRKNVIPESAITIIGHSRDGEPYLGSKTFPESWDNDIVIRAAVRAGYTFRCE